MYSRRQRPRVYPTVERLGVTEPFHQHLASVVTPAQLGLDSIRLVSRHDDLLQLGFVEGAVQAIAVPVDLSIHGRIQTVRVDDLKQFFRPVRHVTFLEVTFRLAYAHAIDDSILGRPADVVPVQPLPYRFLICAVHRRRSQTDAPMIGPGVVVRTHEILQRVDVADRLVLREITPHARLQGPVESLDDARLRLIVVRRKVMHAVLFQQRLQRPVQKLPYRLAT